MLMISIASFFLLLLFVVVLFGLHPLHINEVFPEQSVNILPSVLA